ncbi:sugar ABC transporter substrate-binding protein [Herbiconiux sp. CPCC 205763]|uniref:Sugar ABC transporter substrate-binding protein n=1 Tax=Herbiconiux aconitum TaxID=2970913 RepID=A0ABT2GPU0_9MICO|nr:sugar ABC transporter substrate-binding protein [Herbiconiux aconitum]MCS5716944.1 sugar ABC transporter substrate-binding protein [Herbiconiux aconitum]
MKHSNSQPWRKRLGKLGLSAALAAGLVLGASACAGGTTATGDDVGSDGSGISGKRITFVTFGMQYEFIVGLVTTVQERLEAAGAEVTIVDGKSDPNLQTTQLQDALAQQPDAVIVDPVDPALMTAGIQKANQQGVPVFIVESLPEDVEYTSFVGYDNVAAGELGAQTLAEAIGDKGTVLQLQGGEASKQAGERKEGFDTEMANHPDITVKDLKTEWTAENANSMTLDAFTTDPDIVGIWSHNDEMIRGSVEALKQLGKDAVVGEDGHVVIVGHDGTPLALDRIREGVQDASVVYDAIEMGNITADNAEAFFSDESFEKDTIIQPFIANADNVDDDSLWGNLPSLQK